MKFGIIGAGQFSRYILEAYKKYFPDVTIRAVVDKDQDLAKELAADFAIALVLSDVDSLLADQSLDIVIILTPPNTHFQLAKQALLAGKHVLVEKPIAFNRQDAQELFDLAAQENLQLCANFVLRFHPFHQELRTIVQEKRYGQMKRIVSSAALAEYPAEHWYWDKLISGGFFLNTYCHFTDLFDFISGETPFSYQSTGNVETGHQINLEYKDYTATLSTYLHASNDQESIRTDYWFDQAVISLDGWLPKTMTITARNGHQVVKKTNRPKDEAYQQALSAIMAEFIGRIDGSVKQPQITNESVLQSVISAVGCEENPLD